MAMTLALFVGALFIKGLTHDLFLEAGVFLISVKLILMSYKHGVYIDQIHHKLDELKALLGVSVDVVSSRGLKPKVRERLLRDARSL